MTTPLELEGIRHRYGDTPVLAGVDLTVAPGELVAVLGASGCGKTTLLRSIAGLVCPTAGRITVGGRVVAEDGRERIDIRSRGIGLVFQDYALFPTLTVRRNIAYGLRDDPARIAELIDRVGLTGLEDRFPSALSGGQQQRVALARALAPRPDLLLLDEPFANVDAARRTALGIQLRQTLALEGRAALLVTHDRGDALGLADRVMVLVAGPDGAVVGQLGTPTEVYRTPDSDDVAALTGPVSRFQGRCVRPESLRLEPEGNEVVEHTRFQGDHFLVSVRVDEELVTVRHDAPVAAGSFVTVRSGS